MEAGKKEVAVIDSILKGYPLGLIYFNRNKNWQNKFNEMDADHVTAWSKGGSTDIANCQMLCKTHNRTKGNR